ncbi:MAG: DUF1570 domain-containing protein [Kiritimatiellae bacterium]|nr:DUF1570 domain-containing protein [Kiritimatiellia bacterium]
MAKTMAINTMRTVTLVLVALAMRMDAQAANGFQFLKSTDLPTIGLRLRPPAGASEKPLAPPRIYTYELKSQKGTQRVERFDPRELWIADHHASEWQDNAGNGLMLATLKYKRPSGFPHEHVDVAQYRQKVPSGASSDTWSPEQALHWVRDYTGDTALEINKARVSSTRIESLYTLTFTAQSNYFVGYLFRLKKGATPGAAGKRNWYLAVFKLSSSAKQDKALLEIKRRFLPYIAGMAVTSNVASGPARRFQGRRTKQSTTERSVEYQKSCKQVADSIQNLKNWWYVETANYILLSNLDIGYRNMVKELQSDLEALHSVYEKLVPARRPIEAVSVIRIFATETEYVNYVDKNFAWSIGIWMGSRKELVVRPFDKGSTSNEKQQIKKTTYHEAFHQYLHYALDQESCAAWFNEGHASLFENVSISRNSIQLLECPDRVKTIKYLIANDLLDLKELVNSDYRAFYGNDDQTRAKNYAVSWALCYFLRKHADPRRIAPYAGLADNYVEAFMKSGSADAATQIVFADIDMATLEKDFRAFWKSTNDRSKAKRFHALDRLKP